MTLEPRLVHASLAGVAPRLVRHAELQDLDLPKPQRLVAETIVALLGSARMPDEMAEYADVLNTALDACARRKENRSAGLIEALRGARDAARSLEAARSGMAGDLALDRLRLALDDARAFCA